MTGLGPIELLKRSVKEFLADDMTTYAAALAYTILFALFPFVIFLLAVMSFLNIPQFFSWLLDQARSTLPQQAVTLVEGVVGQIQGKSQGGLLSFGILAAIWSASGGVRSLMNALNVAYDVESRPTWKRYPLSILFTILLAVMLIFATALMLLGPQVITWIADQAAMGQMVVTLWTWLRIPVAVILLVAAVAIIYYALPNADQPFRLITPGAVLAVLVWVTASISFSYYMSNLANYSATYGSLGAVIALLFYFFISSAVLLLGAEMNGVLYHRASEDRDRERTAADTSRSKALDSQ